MNLAPFTLRGHNPDVLTCIANLSNDEVFTPPGFANEMLDTLAAAWAEANDGADIWANPEVTFLDPFGVAMLRDTRSDLVERLSALIRASRVSTMPGFSISICSRENSRPVNSTFSPLQLTVWRAMSICRGPTLSTGSAADWRLRRAVRMRASSSSMEKGLVM